MNYLACLGRKPYALIRWPLSLAIVGAAMICAAPGAHAGGTVQGDPDTEPTWAEFEAVLDEALATLDKIDHQAAVDLEGLKSGVGGIIAPLPSSKSGGLVVAEAAGDYQVLTNPDGELSVFIRISILGIDDSSFLCGTLLHEWEHWQDDKANDPSGSGGVDGDDGSVSELGNDPTPEELAKYRHHADLQLLVALEICYKNYEAGTYQSIVTCAVIEGEYNSAQAHYAKLGDLAMIASIQSMIDNIREECGCLDYATY